MTAVAIRTQNLTRTFETVRAVDGISFEVPSGIVFGFLGPNGSGKTTTIRLLLGLLEPTSGSAEVLGFDTATHADDIRQRCGALLEHTGLYERMTAEDNLEFYGRVWHLNAAERQQRIHDLLDAVGLWDRRKEPVGNWSRGMKQKLAVARAMLHRPQIIFLDEPTAGLDPIAAVALRDELAALVQQQGVTVFLTTHNLAEAEKLCQQVAVIRQGQLMMIGSPDELRLRQGGSRLEIVGRGFTEAALSILRQQPQVKEVTRQDQHITIALKDDADTAPLVQLLVSQGVQIDEVRRGKASLEEVFLTLMEEDKHVE
ncbi:MAG TPA: ABC transporter ATP-binding protein [Anaerolineaceae bacterium]|nr:ABC transporter ATP-binding protein [Anaerolineaceae bacterium]HNS36725.1 ABC transporter ATP-binding protein [Anaerolineaceae bacterium]HOD03852.1 ABC transporter ATP-binding protein [Anaerolineaceae bacterium]HOG78742.1 ABC transporter ATP-binding protein [Anaerolineaceae bacterium]